MSDTTLEDVTNAVAAGNAGFYKKIPPLFQVYREEQSGRILAVSGDHTYWIPSTDVLNLGVTVGLFEKEIRSYGDYVGLWAEIISNSEPVEGTIKADTSAILAAVNSQTTAAAWQAVQDDDPKNGAIYAVGPGVFFHIVSYSEVQAMQKAKLLSADVRSMTTAEISTLRDQIVKGAKVGEMYSPPKSAS
jgi:hypothetical protein